MIDRLERVAKLNGEAIQALRDGDSITARSKCLFVEQELRDWQKRLLELQDSAPDKCIHDLVREFSENTTL